MFGLGVPELLIIFLIVLLVFGGSRLPKLAKSLGEAQKEFKKGTGDDTKPSDGSPTPPPA